MLNRMLRRKDKTGKEDEISVNVKDLEKPSFEEMNAAFGKPSMFNYNGDKVWVDDYPDQLRAAFWYIYFKYSETKKQMKLDNKDATDEEVLKLCRTVMTPFIDASYKDFAKHGIKQVVGDKYDVYVKRKQETKSVSTGMDSAMKRDSIKEGDLANLDDEDDEDFEEAKIPNVIKTTVVSSVSRLTTIADVESLSTMDLFEELANGLEYDKFNPHEMRKKIFERTPTISLNQLVTLCMTYIFIGNNSTRLSEKVKVKQIGSIAAQVVNMFGVIRKKESANSITLARIGVAFAPVVWILRNELKNKGSLPSSGVITSTPVVLQDVALAGVQKRISDGTSISDFLIKFNRALTKFREKSQQTKTSETEMDETANKFMGVAMFGAESDPIVSKWNFNALEFTYIGNFYDHCVSVYLNGERP